MSTNIFKLTIVILTQICLIKSEYLECEKNNCILKTWNPNKRHVINYSSTGEILLEIESLTRQPLTTRFELDTPNCNVSSLKLMNFASIDLRFDLTKFMSRVLNVDLMFSNFKFTNYMEDETHFFSNIHTVNQWMNTELSNQMDPRVFKNAAIKEINFMRMSDTLIKRNVISFKNVSITELNSSISTVYMECFNVKIDNRILHPQVFEKLTRITFGSFTKRIEPDTFSRFALLQDVLFAVFSLKYLFHEDSAWLRSLNSNVSVNYSAPRDEVMRQKALLLELRTTHFFNRPNLKNNAYDFPDEDFCLFRHFPFEQYVFPVLHVSTCSCTRAWLTRFFFFFELDSHMLCWNDRFCDFDRMLARCDQPGKIQNWSMPIDIYYVDDQYWHFRTANFVLSMWVTPAVSLVGLVANLLSVATLRNSNFRKNMKQRMFDQMLANSVIDATVCLIGALGPLSLCIDVNSNFCMLAVVSSKPLRIFFIVLNQYVSGVLRTWSNCVHIMLSLDRFNLSTDSNHKLLAKFAEIKQHKLLLASLGYSMIINIIKLFQFDFDIISAYVRFPLLNPVFFNFFKAQAYLNLLVFLSNSFALVLCQLIVDIVLFFFMKRALKAKKMSMIATTVSAPQIAKTEHSKDRIKKMVIINGFLIFFLHLPELLVSIHLSSLFGHFGEIISADSYESDYFEAVAPFLTEASNVVYLVSFIVNVLFYFFFNKIFRKSFRDLLCSK
nr:G protein-coupled receptor [Proales similis]